MPELAAGRGGGRRRRAAGPAATGGSGFRHELLREAVYADLPDPATLHDRVAGRARPGRPRRARAPPDAARARAAEAAAAWAAAAAHARSVGALDRGGRVPRAGHRLAPADGRLWLELAEVWAWLGPAGGHGARPGTQALALLPGPDAAAGLVPPRPAAPQRASATRRRRCGPTGTAQALLTPDADDELRAEMLIGLAWGDAVAGRRGRRFEALLAAAEALLPGRPDPATRRRHRRDPDAGPDPAGPVRRARSRSRWPRRRRRSRGRLPERACGALDQRRLRADLRRRLRGRPRSSPTRRSPRPSRCRCCSSGAWRRGRTSWPGSAGTTRPPPRRAGSGTAPTGWTRRRWPPPPPTTRGLVALAAGRYAEAAELLGAALADGAEVSRPTAGLHRAEALALAGDPAAATAQLRAALLEPVGRADQPWALVPRIAWVQGLVATRAGTTCRWPGAGSTRRPPAGAGCSARRRRPRPRATWPTMVDLGRPPVVGLVEPDRELARIDRDARIARAAAATRGDA